MQPLLTDYFPPRHADVASIVSPPCPEALPEPVPLVGAAKRKADTDWGSDSERPPKRHRGSNPTAARIYRRFQDERGLDFSYAIFLGLCGYLSAILQWNYGIPIAAFDSFICEYRRFENTQPPASVRSYHQWLQDQLPLRASQMNDTILDEQNLRALAHENPYTFKLVQESLEVIGREKDFYNQHPSQLRFSDRNSRIHDQQASTARRTPPTSSDAATTPHSIVLAQFQSPATCDPDRSPWHSEKELRDALCLRDKDEFLAWLTQDWVVDVYTEYCVAELDIRRAKEERLQQAKETIPPSPKRASAKFLINNAIMALESSRPRFLNESVDKSNWSPEDHDVRFIVQLVRKGRSPGHWWERQIQPEITEELCTVAYRLLSWLRYCHRLSSARSQSSQVQRASAHQWYSHLRAARQARTLERQSR